MATNRYPIFKIVNFAFIALSSILLYFVSELWIGSQEDYLELISNSKTMFLIKKSLLSISVSLFLGLIGFLAGKYVFKINKDILRKTVKVDIIILIAVSIIQLIISLGTIRGIFIYRAAIFLILTDC